MSGTDFLTVTDRYVIRERNEKLVLKTIIRRDSISRADIAKETLLNKATVSSIVADLLDRNLLTELGEGQSSGGRKPILVRFNHQAGIVLSVDLRPDRMIFLFTYLNGEPLMEERLPKIKMTNETIQEALLGIVGTHSGNLPITPYHLVGITLAIHGIINQGALVFSPFYELDTLKLKEELEERLAVPVHIENEANLGALGEQEFSTPSSNLISVNIKYGIGAGIILNNELFRGANGFAGEVGHMIAVPGGRPCPCGNHGCLEQYASEYMTLNAYLPGGAATEREIRKKFLADFEAGAPQAIQAVEEFATYLAIGLNNLMTSFNPSVIVLNSRLFENPGILRLIKSKLTYRLNGRTMIKSSTLHEKATLLGGTKVACDQFLKI